MLNILLAFRAFGPQWVKKKLLIKCDNDAVVKVLNSGRTCDPFLGTCARNIWFQAALGDVDVRLNMFMFLEVIIKQLIYFLGGIFQQIITIN